MYSCEASSKEAFLQQLAIAYIANGYWFYVTGQIPERKDPQTIDQKLIAKFGIGISKWARARRKQAGLANVHYLRFGRFFVLIWTKGEHPVFEEHPDFKDVRRDPVRFAGYSISYKLGVDRKWHPSVRIHPKEYRELKAYLLGLAVCRSVQALSEEFRKVPFEPYAPVRRQLLNILRAVNRERLKAGFERVPLSALRLSRRALKVFTVELKKAA